MATPSGVAPASLTKTQLTLYAPPDRQHERVLRLGPPGSSGSGGGSGGGGGGSTAIIHVQEICDPDEQAEGSIASQREESYGRSSSQGVGGGGSSGWSGRGVAGPGSSASTSTTGGCGCPYADKDNSSSASGRGSGASSDSNSRNKRGGVGAGGEEEKQRSLEYEVRTAEPSQLYLYMPPSQQASHVAESNESRRQQGAQRGVGGRGGQTARLGCEGLGGLLDWSDATGVSAGEVAG
ncbi:unnamed protein product [Closterium sp. Naga37s-1]|nr:unnamed protein product [Closterium sp. Naga37s-1]